jgi:hypothetical protein
LLSNSRVRSNLARTLLCCAFLSAFPATAFAEWHIVPFIGLTFAQKTTLIDLDFDASDELGAPDKESHRNFGAVVSRLGEGVLGFEGLFVWTPDLFTVPPVVESSRSMAFMGNVVLTTPRRLTEYGLRPFVSGGIGALQVSAEKAGDVGVSTYLAAFNVGGGAIGFFTNRTGVRFEIRFHQAFGREAEPLETIVGERVRVRYMTFSVGLVFRRGVS